MRAGLIALGFCCVFPCVLQPVRTTELRAYEVDRPASKLFIVTHRSGLLSFLGHEHAIVPGDWDADLCLSEPASNDMRAAFVIRTGSLVIDSDSARALAGLGGGPDADDVLEIQRKLLDADHLDAGRYPEARIETDSVAVGDDHTLVVTARLTLRGITRPVRFRVRFEVLPGNALRLAGTLRIRQRDFGIRPESIARVVNVSNDVDLHVELIARPTLRPCP